MRVKHIVNITKLQFGRIWGDIFLGLWDFVVVLSSCLFVEKELKVRWVELGRGSGRTWGRGRTWSNIFKLKI